MKLAATGSSVIGPTHLTENTPNQDAVLVRGFQKGWCISVADGLGSRPLSHIGSHYCVQSVRRSLKRHAGFNSTPLQLSQQMQYAWRSRFGDGRSAFETTCLWAYVNTDGSGMAAQIGDGLLLVRSQGQLKVITPLKDGFGNQTQTLSKAKDHDWTTVDFTLAQPGDGVLLMTDGISDDLIPEHLEGFFDAIFQQLKRSNKRRCKHWLNKELKEWTTPRHGDDKSIAGIFRTE